MTEQPETFEEWSERTRPSGGFWSGDRGELVVLSVLAVTALVVADDLAGTLIGVMLALLALECALGVFAVRRGISPESEWLVVVRGLCLAAMVPLIFVYAVVGEPWLGIVLVGAVVMRDLTHAPSLLRRLFRRRRADGP